MALPMIATGEYDKKRGGEFFTSWQSANIKIDRKLFLVTEGAQNLKNRSNFSDSFTSDSNLGR